MLLIWYTGSIVAGFLLGTTFYYLYRISVPSGLTRRYWASMGKNIVSLLKDDIAEFWKIYRRIVISSLGYAARQMGGIFLAIVPTALVMIFIGPWIQAGWNVGGPLIVYPESAGKVVETKVTSALPGSDSTPFKYSIALDDGHHYKLENPWLNHVICPEGSVAGWLLTSIGFTRITDETTAKSGKGLFIVRAFKDDWNPLWPYLNDPEFIFFSSFSLIAIVLMLRKKKQTGEDQDTGYDMSPVDYILTGIATRYAGAICALGNWESRRMARKLASIKIEKPIFITGLARAGTTILLETLSTVNTLATHRYRDFPFIMTPIFWNGFISLFAAKQDPMERPHKDRIKITRESPDAFEEPIWQHFFPFLHDPESIHTLDSTTQNASFETFYREHLQKIVLLRKGQRYLSKGNYNLTRLGYLLKMFPDARFLIPVRHPLHHIESLVRQHRLFEAYASENQHIPEYLKAVGHYEFGPQRQPICLSKNAGKRIMEAWKKGDDYLGYALQWSEIYRYLADLMETDCLSDSAIIIRYEDLCADPEKHLEQILTFVGLENHSASICKTQTISPSSRPLKMPAEEIDACWGAVEMVAARFGYRKKPEEMERPFQLPG